MKKISFLKKLKLFSLYKKEITNLEIELATKFNARVDRAYRVYTVLNIPTDIVEEPYNIRKSDIDNIAKTYIKEYSSQLSKLLNERGLMELFTFYQTKKVDKYSYLLVYGFSLFKSHIFYRNYYIFMGFLSLVGVISIFSLLMMLIF